MSILSALNNELTGLYRQLDEVTAEREYVRARYDHAESQLIEAKQRIARLESQIDAATRTYNAVQSERDEARRALADMTAKYEECDRAALCLVDMYDMACEQKHRVIDELKSANAELAAQRMCVTCGKYAPPGASRTYEDPACTATLPEGTTLNPCCFDLTPDEAWQHWSREAHRLRGALVAVRRHLAEDPAYGWWSARAVEDLVDDALRRSNDDV